MTLFYDHFDIQTTYLISSNFTVIVQIDQWKFPL